MFQVEWDQEDLDELLLDLDGIKPPNSMKDMLSKWAYETEMETKGYPPVPEGSTYVRTENLFRGWVREAWPMKARVYNPVDYGIFVQGREQTAKHQSTGWKRLHEVGMAKLEQLIYRLEMVITGIWET